MMSNVLPFTAKKVATRCCPECGYIMAQVEIDALRVVVNCPRRCGTSINDFVVFDMSAIAKQYKQDRDEE